MLAVDGKRATLSIGLQARVQHLLVRRLGLIQHFSSGLSLIPERISAEPWGLSHQRLLDALPPRRELAAAWLLLIDTGQSLAFGDWVALILSTPTAAQAAALWLWLQEDQLWFVMRQQQISARPAPDLRRLRQQRRQHQLVLQARIEWHGQLRSRQPVGSDRLNPVASQELSLLLQWANGDTAITLPTSLQQALRDAHCALEPSAIRHLLVDLGQWDPHALPSLRQSHWAEAFSPELENLAEALIASADQPRPGDEHRLDLCSQHCFSIDDDDTEDIDDALGLELTAAGQQRLWIHVADPGRLIATGDPLDLEARRRASSLYLTQGILPMFPWNLSSGPLSLRAGRRCPAWSIWVALAGDGSVAEFGIVRSWIRPAYRLSYSDADDLIDLAPPEEPALAQMHTLLAQRRRWREVRGALLLDQPEGRIRQRTGAAPLVAITEPSPGRLLVAEAMILAGAVVAAYGQANGLALPYRTQLPSSLPPAELLQRLPAGPVRHAALKQGLGRGLTGTSAAPHFSLGLEAYVQATSPIRRYGDLLVQRQLALHQSGAQPIEASAMQTLLSELEAPLREGNQISRDDQRHWRQVWFAEHRAEQWQATFLRWLRESDQLGLVWIESLAMELPAQCPAGSQPADALLLKVHRVDPLQDQLQLRAHR
mgnify:FL=1